MTPETFLDWCAALLVLAILGAALFFGWRGCARTTAHHECPMCDVFLEK